MWSETFFSQCQTIPVGYGVQYLLTYSRYIVMHLSILDELGNAPIKSRVDWRREFGSALRTNELVVPRPLSPKEPSLSGYFRR